MSRNPKPFNIDEMTFEQMRSLRNMRNSQLNQVKAILDGKKHTIYRKNKSKLYASAIQYQNDLEKLDFAMNDLSKVGTPIAIYS